jgi:hypothetical protein
MAEVSDPWEEPEIPDIDIIEVEDGSKFFNADGSFIVDSYNGTLRWLQVGNEIMELIKPLDGNRIQVRRGIA